MVLSNVMRVDRSATNGQVGTSGAASQEKPIYYTGDGWESGHTGISTIGGVTGIHSHALDIRVDRNATNDYTGTTTTTTVVEPTGVGNVNNGNNPTAQNNSSGKVNGSTLLIVGGVLVIGVLGLVIHIHNK